MHALAGELEWPRCGLRAVLARSDQIERLRCKVGQRGWDRHADVGKPAALIRSRSPDFNVESQNDTLARRKALATEQDRRPARSAVAICEEICRAGRSRRRRRRGIPARRCGASRGIVSLAPHSAQPLSSRPRWSGTRVGFGARQAYNGCLCPRGARIRCRGGAAAARAAARPNRPRACAVAADLVRARARRARRPRHRRRRPARLGVRRRGGCAPRGHPQRARRDPPHCTTPRFTCRDRDARATDAAATRRRRGGGRAGRRCGCGVVRHQRSHRTRSSSRSARRASTRTSHAGSTCG